MIGVVTRTLGSIWEGVWGRGARDALAPLTFTGYRFLKNRRNLSFFELARLKFTGYPPDLQATPLRLDVCMTLEPLGMLFDRFFQTFW